ncbi:hypothetical protein [Blastopirellula marina]|uniref:HEAT repeat domain-containing protein n=1 Tax=Blastopirellula marina TaxID=124 RepID=A0A2S8GK69_9BACT|nr:hypothetical protein [Blastopirellula marina]PQO44838.1 hypothetical protein C5Y93_17240 [Blastopirellula marina]
MTETRRRSSLGAILKRTAWVILGFVALGLSLQIARQYRQVQATVAKLDAQIDSTQEDLQQLKQEETDAKDKLLSYMKQGIPVNLPRVLRENTDDQWKQKAIEIILANLDHPNLSTRIGALRQVRELSNNYPAEYEANLDEMIPKLAKSILPLEEMKDSTLQFYLFNLLSELGPRTRVAIPELRQLARTPESNSRLNAVRLILEIDLREDVSTEITQLIRDRRTSIQGVKKMLDRLVGEERSQFLLQKVQANLDQDNRDDPAEGKKPL